MAILGASSTRRNTFIIVIPEVSPLATFYGAFGARKARSFHPEEQLAANERSDLLAPNVQTPGALRCLARDLLY